MPDASRERGILSPADRVYLRDEADFSSTQAERNARARIRDRVFEATLDYELLVEHLDDHDRELVFEKRFGSMDGAEAFDALVSAVAFLYQAVGDTDLDFETVLQEGISVAEARENRAATVRLDLTFQSLNVDQLRHKLEDGKSLSLTELAYLQQRDEIRADEIANYFQESDAATEVDDGRIQSKVTNF